MVKEGKRERRGKKQKKTVQRVGRQSWKEGKMWSKEKLKAELEKREKENI